MVREQRARRPQPTRKPKQPTPAGSIWETPRMREILSQPVGTPIDFTRDEALAIVRDMIENPRPVDEKALAKAHRELKEIRKMWGTFARFPDD